MKRLLPALGPLLAMMACKKAESGLATLCPPPALNAPLQRALADTLAHGLGVLGDSSSVRASEVALAGVMVGQECAVAATLSWDDGFSGGVLVYRMHDPLLEVLATQPFAGAHAPMAAGPGRVVLSYSGGRGSGQMAERTAVLCALATDNWILCADMLTSQQITATGYPASDSLASGMHLSARGGVSVRGDTLVVTSEIEVKRYGQPVSRRTVTSYHVLP